MNMAWKGRPACRRRQIRKHHWTAKGRNENHAFVVTAFRFGARRGDSDAADATVPSRAPLSPAQPAEAVIAAAAECSWLAPTRGTRVYGG
jgi:hypothetical protein